MYLKIVFEYFAEDIIMQLKHIPGGGWPMGGQETSAQRGDWTVGKRKERTRDGAGTTQGRL